MNKDKKIDRRSFIELTTKAGIVSSAFACTLSDTSPKGNIISRDFSTAPIKIGVVGLGGRGTGAVRDALLADKNVVLWSVGDIKNVTHNLNNRVKGKVGEGRIQIKDRTFIGFDAYKKVIDSGVDIVLLATPPCFRPLHFEYAVKANKHVFMEKPIAIDIPGLKRVIEAEKKAKKKNLSVLTGLVWRYTYKSEKLYEELLSGKYGDVNHAYGVYLSKRPSNLAYENKKVDLFRNPKVDLSARKWPAFLEYSGDSFVEQAIHTVDKVAWAMKDIAPLSCTAHGGQQRPYPVNTFDHFSAEFIFPNNKKGTVSSRQLNSTYNKISDRIYCEKAIGKLDQGGKASIHDIEGKKLWQEDRGGRGYIDEHKRLISYIRKGKRFSDLHSAINSTAMVIMARMAAYTGKNIPWETLWKSKDVLFDLNENYEGKSKMSIRKTARMGTTKVV